MQELVVNLHMHTRYSDGHASHSEIARQAILAGIDAVITTDHNILVKGIEGYYRQGSRRVLMLVGEEIHDQARNPQKSHLLVFGTGRELAPLAQNPQKLVDRVIQSGGLAFIAHPFEDALPLYNEDDISWEDWQVDGYTGIELWNGMSEFKSVVKNRLQAIFYAFYPQYLGRGPLKRTLNKWDELLINGKHIVAIGGSDAHALPARLGPIRRTIYPYQFHFRGINNHVIISDGLTGNAPDDSRAILDAIKHGHSFVAYDLPAPTNGFRFTAHATDGTFIMGDDVPLIGGVTFQIKLPLKVESSLICNGQIIKTWHEREFITFAATRPGAYRVEAHINYLSKRRAWIFSNPIYVH